MPEFLQTTAKNPKAIHAVVLTLTYISGMRDVVETLGLDKLDTLLVKDVARNLRKLYDMLEKYKSDLVEYLPKSTEPAKYTSGADELLDVLSSSIWHIEISIYELVIKGDKATAYANLISEFDYLIYRITYIITQNYFK